MCSLLLKTFLGVNQRYRSLLKVLLLQYSIQINDTVHYLICLVWRSNIRLHYLDLFRMQIKDSAHRLKLLSMQIKYFLCLKVFRMQIDTAHYSCLGCISELQLITQTCLASRSQRYNSLDIYLKLFSMQNKTYTTILKAVKDIQQRYSSLPKTIQNVDAAHYLKSLQM